MCISKKTEKIGANMLKSKEVNLWAFSLLKSNLKN